MKTSRDRSITNRYQLIEASMSRSDCAAEEPVKPKGRNRKAQAATLSMFEWALSLE